MFLKFSLALSALAIVGCQAAAVTDTANQDSAFSKVKVTETVISQKITKEVPFMPPLMIIGNNNGSITRCPIDKPNSCEVFHTSPCHSNVTSTVVYGEYLYASLESGIMLRCVWQRRHSCYEFNQAGTKISGLAVAAGYIHAGLKNGTILRCELDSPHSCWHFADVPREILSFAAFDSHIYAGSHAGHIYRCWLTEDRDCSIFYENGWSDVYGMVRLGEKMYGLKYAGAIHYFNMDFYQQDYQSIGLSGNGYTSMALYNRKLYIVLKSKGIYTNNLGSESVKLIAVNENAVSISFTYGTFGIQNQYRLEAKKCIYNDGIFTCPPTVVYYDVRSRAQWEVSVKNGSLYDSQGVILDTSDADENYSQKAAIFVMGPDGQILVSKFHKRGHTHTSSLLAGNEVAGAGLIVAEQGKIRSITACSAHYRPDVELNSQVKESLYVKGYKEDFYSYPCTYSAELCEPVDVSNIY
ncbi:uncharacterized protein LOC134677036 [Cydia fagiglandana]|uniref:uncharacterized protein LOC134677036 n=1 Tax=Cydia fagiglandana TaxID=1458189 RepID=UPI002FEE193E